MIATSFLLIAASYIVKFPMQNEDFVNTVVEVRETVFSGTIAIYLVLTLAMGRGIGARLGR